jgi:adenine-specific DNA-methyltransferase
VIRFEFKPDPERRKQADLNATAVDRILNQTTGFDDWRRELASLSRTERNPNRTLLEKHLTDYTARNTFDYFIHKDLGGFLRRELDFYIKNEVMHLDDIESETAPRVEQYLSKIKAIRRIAHKLIDFLAQIENFQKKLWLKKKFVVETHYCITLDRIYAIDDEKARDWLLDQIIKNDAQREEWVRLFAIDEIKGDLTVPGYSNPLKPEFLKAHPTLVVDTRQFDEAFKLRLLAAIPDLDEETDGLLIHSENFQALNLLQARYREQVKCIYIDPPYNTGSDEFTYKDRYQHSSWLAMMESRLCTAKVLLAPDALVFVHIDEREQAKLDGLMQEIFGAGSSLGPFIWLARVGKAVTERVLQVKHEYILCARMSGRARLKLVENEITRCRY